MSIVGTGSSISFGDLTIDLEPFDNPIDGQGMIKMPDMKEALTGTMIIDTKLLFPPMPEADVFTLHYFTERQTKREARRIRRNKKRPNGTYRKKNYKANKGTTMSAPAEITGYDEESGDMTMKWKEKPMDRKGGSNGK